MSEPRSSYNRERKGETNMSGRKRRREELEREQQYRRSKVYHREGGGRPILTDITMETGEKENEETTMVTGEKDIAEITMKTGGKDIADITMVTMTERRITVVTESCGPHREEWWPCLD